MGRVAVIGGGVSGCSAAYRLAEAGIEVVLIEKENFLGGNIRNFGCKADDKCVKDNLCLVEGVFDKVREHKSVEIHYNTEIVDLSGTHGSYSLEVVRNREYYQLTDIYSIILASGGIRFSEKETGSIQWADDKSVIWASELEAILYKRKSGIELDEDIKSAVFIQCNGSRSVTEKADYCSRVCCGYAYRMSRALKYFYPSIKIAMLYMDLQEAGYMQELSFEELDKQGIEYKLCKPVSIERKDGAIAVSYEDRTKGGMENISTDLVVLSEGIHPGYDNEKMAGIFNLQADRKGFLHNIEDDNATGIYLAGTVKGPRDIAASINEAKNAADSIISLLQGGVCHA